MSCSWANTNPDQVQPFPSSGHMQCLSEAGQGSQRTLKYQQNLVLFLFNGKQTPGVLATFTLFLFFFNLCEIQLEKNLHKGPRPHRQWSPFGVQPQWPANHKWHWPAVQKMPLRIWAARLLQPRQSIISVQKMRALSLSKPLSKGLGGK